MTSTAVGGPEQARSVTVPALDMREVSKTFAGVRALERVTLRVEPGEIRGLIGRNGSGKSTLIKILAGYHAPDPGAEISVNDSRLDLPVDPTEVASQGMSFVHQDLGLDVRGSILENICIGTFRTGFAGRIRWATEHERAGQALRSVGVTADLDRKVGTLPPVERALVALARSLAQLGGRTGGVLVLDEPSAYLPPAGVAALFSAIRRLAANRIAVVYVSHRLEEVIELTDTVTVLRDGRLVDTIPTPGATEDMLIEAMLGSRVDDLYPETHRAQGEQRLAIESLCADGLHDVSFEAAQGEIVGFTGLTGSGFERLLPAVYGHRRATQGTMRLDGTSLDLAAVDPARLVRSAVAYLPADRQRDSGVPTLSIGANVNLPLFRRFYRGGRMRSNDEAASATTLLKQFEVRPLDHGSLLANLSGGNQQKALLAKWVQMNPRVLLLDEPTQGVDIGSKKELFQRIEEIAQKGCAVLVASAEHEDLANICHRVYVMRDGRLVSELSGSRLTEQAITEQSYRGASVNASGDGRESDHGE